MLDILKQLPGNILFYTISSFFQSIIVFYTRWHIQNSCLYIFLNFNKLEVGEISHCLHFLHSSLLHSMKLESIFLEQFVIQKHFNQFLCNYGIWTFCFSAKTPTVEGEIMPIKVNFTATSKPGIFFTFSFSRQDFSLSQEPVLNSLYRPGQP